MYKAKVYEDPEAQLVLYRVPHDIVSEVGIPHALAIALFGQEQPNAQFVEAFQSMMDTATSVPFERPSASSFFSSTIAKFNQGVDSIRFIDKQRQKAITIMLGSVGGDPRQSSERDFRDHEAGLRRDQASRSLLDFYRTTHVEDYWGFIPAVYVETKSQHPRALPGDAPRQLGVATTQLALARQTELGYRINPNQALQEAAIFALVSVGAGYGDLTRGVMVGDQGRTTTPFSVNALPARVAMHIRQDLPQQPSFRLYEGEHMKPLTLGMAHSARTLLNVYNNRVLRPGNAGIMM